MSVSEEEFDSDRQPRSPAERAQYAQLVLSADRTILAVERTYAAWVRTGLSALASGVAARAFLDDAVPVAAASAMASLLILFGGFCFAAGVWRELRQFRTSVRPDLSSVPAAILLTANSVMVLISVTALIGVWVAEKS